MKLVSMYREMFPQKINRCHGLEIGDEVAYKKSQRVVQRVWGKRAGKITELRKGRSGPLLLSGTKTRNIGPEICVARIGRNQFSDTRDLRKTTHV